MKTLTEILDNVNRSAGGSFDGPVDSVQTERVGGETALHIVAKWGDAEAIRVLVANGAGLNKPGEDNNTPLHYAAMLGKLAAVHCLVELGALNSKDRYGNTPAELAYDHKDVHDFLKAHNF
jgi:ankyrin repeat protein